MSPADSAAIPIIKMHLILLRRIKCIYSFEASFIIKSFWSHFSQALSDYSHKHSPCVFILKSAGGQKYEMHICTDLSGIHSAVLRRITYIVDIILLFPSVTNTA